MAALGAISWCALAVALWSDSFGPISVARPDWLAFAMFLVVIVASRAMAFPLFRDSIVSLDSGFYVAAAVCLGSMVSGALVAVALLVDSVSRVVIEPRERARGVSAWLAALVYGLYFGGMSGALLMVVAWGMQLDALYVLSDTSDLEVLGRVLVVGVLFLLGHYLLQGLRWRLSGESLKHYLVKMAVPGIVVESAVLPLAAILVFLYEPERPLKFALLGTTYLVINYAFNRISNTSEELRQRVSELETLSATSRRLTASLQIHELVETLAQEVMQALPEASRLSLAHKIGAKSDGGVVTDIYDRAANRFERQREDSLCGVTALVVDEEHSKYLPDVHFADGEIRSWLGVPVQIYDSVEGVLAVQSNVPYAFGPEHMRLLEAIGSQAAVALQNARLYELAMVDGLTGLFVRRYFDARMQEEIERSSRFSTAFSVVLLDIDDFKEINDSHGHPVGDRALYAVARAVAGEMRGVDTAARYGGEELALILPRTGMIDAHAVAERVRRRVAGLEIPVDKGDSVGLTVSIGVASHPESGAQDADALVRLADRALYRAKKAGKNRVELYWGDSEEAPLLRPVP